MKKIISLVLTLSLLMSTVNVAFPINAYAENSPEDLVNNFSEEDINAESNFYNKEIWALENGIELDSNIELEETDEQFGLYSMLQEGDADAHSVSLMANFEFSTLSGKVVDSTGNGISGVSVQLYNIDENVCVTSCTTGSNGFWTSVEYDVIADYRYIIRYYKAGYEFSDNNIECIAVSGGTVLDNVIGSKLDFDNLVCNVEDYEYTVSDDKATISKYNGSDSALLLPSELGGYPVTALGNKVFRNNTVLKTICLSENITSIGSEAFYGCTALKNVYFPNELTTIGSSAFYRCSSLLDIALPNNLTTIGSSAFYECISFSEIELPNSVKTIKSSAFSNCINFHGEIVLLHGDSLQTVQML